ncbi:NUDIX hydrolase [Colwellia psychrerythraea]|uniref:Phosphatase NudJ n=1 Tax=Colwellia psychrerythraea TaxID=28229 RepID=A0A099L435_COLPS|nr:NUDIX hydrolase [Colwellia psychrerythraea]
MASIKLSSNSKNALGSNEQVKNDHGEKQFKPNTTVAAVIHHQGKFLFVEEIDNNHVVYNQPAGHLEADESLITAIKREVLEETGLALVPDYLCGIYYFHRPDLNLYFLRFCFVIELEQWLKGQPQDNEIIDTHWFSFEQIKLKRHQLRSAMVLECIEDYLAGNKIPLSQLKSNL